MNVASSMPPITPVPIECRLAAPAPELNGERQHAEDERERGHDDRPEAQARALDRRLGERHAFAAP